MTLPHERYDAPKIQAFFGELQERAAAVPGAAAATVAAQYPPFDFSRERFRVIGAEPLRDDELPTALFTSVTPSYLAATGVRPSAKVPLATWAWLRTHRPETLDAMARWAGVADLAAKGLPTSRSSWSLPRRALSRSPISAWTMRPRASGWSR